MIHTVLHSKTILMLNIMVQGEALVLTNDNNPGRPKGKTSQVFALGLPATMLFTISLYKIKIFYQ